MQRDRTLPEKIAKDFSDSAPAQLIQKKKGVLFHSIRVAFGRRRLPTTELQKNLRRRLLPHVSKQFPQCISVTAVISCFSRS